MSKLYDDSKFNSAFATRLRELLEERKITQDTVSKMIGITRQSVNFYTTGVSTPTFDKLALLAKALNVSADYLLGLSDIKNPSATVQGMVKELGFSEETIEILQMWNQKPVEEIVETDGKIHEIIYADNSPDLTYISCLDNIIKKSLHCNFMRTLEFYFHFKKEHSRAEDELEQNPVFIVDDTLENGTDISWLENTEYEWSVKDLQEKLDFQLWKVQKEFIALLETI